MLGLKITVLSKFLINIQYMNMKIGSKLGNRDDYLLTVFKLNKDKIYHYTIAFHTILRYFKSMSKVKSKAANGKVMPIGVP